MSIKAAPKYVLENNFTRILSWLNYFFASLFFSAAIKNAESLLILVTNPPFLGIIGLFWKFFRKQKYIILVYDIHPQILIDLGLLKNGLLTKAWEYLNGLVLRNAEMVFAISTDMASFLNDKYGLSTNRKSVIYIPCWADTDKLRPVTKEGNRFVKRYNLLAKVTFLYAGNMGYAHDIEAILQAALGLRYESKIHFLFVGGGAKWQLIEKTKRENNLENISLFAFQPENDFLSLVSACDVGIVSYKRKTERFMLPSKTFSYIASGLALLVISEEENDITRMARDYYCGLAVRNSDVEGLKAAILKLANDPGRLEGYKKAARQTCENYYSRRNTQLYISAIESSMPLKSRV